MTTRRHFAEIPADEPIPVSMAHKVIGKGKSTIYAWIKRDILVPTPTPDGMMVTPDQLRKAEASVTRGRPAAPRKSPNSETK